jgi:hypothetical protein
MATRAFKTTFIPIPFIRALMAIDDLSRPCCIKMERGVSLTAGWISHYFTYALISGEGSKSKT